MNENLTSRKILLVYFNSLLISIATCQTSIPDVSRCTDITEDYANEEGDTIAYVGWPYHLYCDDDMAYDFSNITATCIVYDVKTGRNIWTSTFEIDEMGYGENAGAYEFRVPRGIDPLQYKIIFQASDECYVKNVTLERKILPSVSCEEAHKSFPPINSCHQVELQAKLSVDLFHSGQPLLFANANDKGVNSYWIRNCNRSVMPDHVMDPVYGKLILPSLKYDEVGNYTYVVEYRGQKRYVISFNVSVKAKTSQTTLSLMCPGSIRTRAGRNATIRCRSDLGMGRDSNIVYGSSFTRLNDTGKYENSSCFTSPVEKHSLSRNKHVICSMIHFGRDPKCYSEVVDPSTAEQTTSYMDYVFTIENFQPSDAGVYEIKVRRVNIIKRAFVTFKLDITPNHWPLIITLAIITAIIFIGFLSLTFYSHVLWVKKHYFAPYERVPEEYTAQIIYHYDEDPPPESNTNLLVEKLTQYITNDLHGSVYDSNRVAEIGGRQDVLQESLDKCSRVIIILSKPYIANDWNSHIVHEALKRKIENGRSVIFVKVPETKEAFSSADPAVYRTLHRATKMCTVLEWKGGIHLGLTLKLELELAMPKIKQIDREDSEEFKEVQQNGQHDLALNGNNNMKTIFTNGAINGDEV